MKRYSIIFKLCIVCCLFESTVIGQTGNSINQSSKNKSTTGTNNTGLNLKKSKMKVSKNKDGSIAPSADDNLSIDSTNVTPVISISKDKS